VHFAVQQNGFALKIVKDQTKEICEHAVKENGFALEYVKEEFKTDEICILAQRTKDSQKSLISIHFSGETKC